MLCSWSYRLSMLLALGLMLGFMAPAMAQPQPPDLARIAQLQGEIAALGAQYDSFLRQPQHPDAALSALNEDLRQTLAALAENYRLRIAYASGPLVWADGSPAPETARAEILLIIANNIAVQERDAERLKRQVESAERALYITPGEEMHARLAAMIAERDRLLGALEAAHAPLHVTRFSLTGAEGALVTAEWSEVGGGAEGDAAVYGLERALAETRSEMATLGTQNRDLAERLFTATRLWNAALDESIARNLDDAWADLVIQALADMVDVSLSVASTGTWTTLRVAFTAFDLALKGTSQYAATDTALTRMKGLGQEQLSAEVKAALSARIAASIASGRPLDFDALGRAGASPLKPAVFGDDIVMAALGAIGQETAKTAVSTAIEAWEAETYQALLKRGSTQPAGVFARFVLADVYDVYNNRWAVADALARSDDAGKLLAEQLTGLGGSLGVSLGGTVLGAARSVISRIGEVSDKELAQALARGEFEIFLLNEAYRQSRARLAMFAALEPALVDGLAAARHRLALKGVRRLMLAGSEVERAAPIAATAVAGALELKLEGAGTGAWRITVSDGDGRVVGTADGSAAGAVVKLPAAAVADLAKRTQPVMLEIAVSGVLADAMVIDSNPATPAAIDPSTLQWVGWDGGADRYGLLLTLTPPITRTERVRVESPFEGNWVVTHEGYPKGGQTVSYYAVYRPWRASCAGEWTGHCEFETVQDPATPLTSGVQSQFTAGTMKEQADGLTIEHGYDYLGYWGSTERIGAGGGDRLSGTWISKDGGPDDHPQGTTTWQRVTPKPKTLTLSGNAGKLSPVDAVGEVALSYNAFDWGPANNTPGSRPSFTVTLRGQDMWGQHIAEFRDTVGLQVRELVPIWSGAARDAAAMTGVTFKVTVWPGVTSGRKTLWFDDQPIAFDFVIEGEP